ncbi:phage portal protein [Luteibacter mycovicinus]|uniref:phage portal protein n=1 Tax=Luteibacter mycovicinus TaxID=1500890 RepID=UPI00056C30C2|nr:phage portal protein [Luteibacter sp. 9143a]
MAKRKRPNPRFTSALPPTAPAADGGRFETFTFGEPEMIDRASLMEYSDLVNNGRWYEPPINPRGLANMMGVAPHHASAIYVKRNLLVASFQETSFLSTHEFAAFATDYMVFANAYLEEVPALSGRLLKLKRSPAMQTRVGVDPGAFYFVPESGIEHAFDVGKVVHLHDTDVKQEIYGVPEYMSALHSAQLNRSATLFRRKYYDNGSHAGFILYLTDAAANTQDIDSLREALRNSKGPGNFRNLFFYAPGGKKDGMQMIPVSEVAAKDDFAAIKNVSRDDILAAHRVPPQILGVVPTNAGGFGDVEKATKVCYANEIVPIQKRMLALNAQLGAEAFKFQDPGADVA